MEATTYTYRIDDPIFIIAFAALVLIFTIGLYVYLSLCTYVIAKKTDTLNAWWAWVPILNILLLLKIARMPYFYLLFQIIPIVSIIFSCIIWSEIAVQRSRPGWWGIMIGIVPFAGFVFLGLLAFTEPAFPAVPSESGVRPASVVSSHSAQETVNVKVQCPSCQNVFYEKAVNDNLLNNKIRCPKCRRAFSKDEIIRI